MNKAIKYEILLTAFQPVLTQLILFYLCIVMHR